MEILFSDNKIVKVAYISRCEELWIEFAEPIKPSYTCAVFTGVPRGLAKNFKYAENREEFFNTQIYKNFRYYLSLFDMCDVFIESNYSKIGEPPPTYAEYEAKLNEEMRKLELDAMNSIR